MAWTKDQELGIFERGKNIIVSAGAGSGKTAVLSERILEYCKAGNDIRKVLVLTFTNKAASEMKERIRNKLIKNNLNEASTLIDSAYITTFDSYSLSLVKRYYYLLGVGSDLSVMDQTFITIKLREIIDKLFDEKYEQKDEEFLDFIEAYLRKNDNFHRDIIFDICNNLDLIIDIDEFVKNYESNYFSEEKLESIEEEYLSLAKEGLLDYIDLLEKLYEYISLEPKQDKLIDFLNDYIDNLKNENDYEKIKVLLSSKMPSLARGSNAKDLKDEAKLKHDEIVKRYFSYPSLDDIKKDILITKKYSMYLLKLSLEVLERLNAFKKEVNRYSFSDIAKMAISLVKNNEDVRNELKYYYNEILVDEYQDTSDLQETFLLEIENNNRYMVGDIKQSIYRFRNANPYIFKNKYDRYALNDGGMKIDLTFNFRSRLEVVNNINLLFNDLMTNKLGDADYKNDHMMQYGQKDYLKINQNYDFNIESLSYDYDFKEGDLKAEEVEAFIAANKIKEIVSKGVLVLGKDGPRKASYSDFAVLISTSTSFQTFKEVFEYCGIPLAIEADLDLKESSLPNLFASILTLILPKKSIQNYNHALAVVARSFLYEYSDEEIFELIRLKKEFPILDDIKKLKMFNEDCYSDLFFEICNIFNVYTKLAKIGDVMDSLAALENIYKMFVMFSDLQMNLSDARDYLVTVMNSNINYKYKVNQNSLGHVKIMTIHASKGLEFPFCIFPMLSKRFNDTESKKTIGFSKNYGIYLPHSGDGEADTIIRELNNKKTREEDLSERIRLWYVALTRAREKIILIRKNTEKEIKYPSKIKSYEDMLKYIKVYDSYDKPVDLDKCGLTSKYKANKEIAKISGKQKLSYNDLDSPVEVIKLNISKNFIGIMSNKERDNIELGLKFHSALEALDFNNPDIDGLPIDDFMKSNLKKILSSDLFKNIANGITYHEHEFYMNKDNESYHGIIDLLVIYDDHVDIIDYKLNNVDSVEYIRQLNIYKEYVKTKWDKPINMYLLSLLTCEIKTL